MRTAEETEEEVRIEARQLLNRRHHAPRNFLDCLSNMHPSHIKHTEQMFAKSFPSLSYWKTPEVNQPSNMAALQALLTIFLSAMLITLPLALTNHYF